jgi:hypothetical protein
MVGCETVEQEDAQRVLGNVIVLFDASLSDCAPD